MPHAFGCLAADGAKPEFCTCLERTQSAAFSGMATFAEAAIHRREAKILKRKLRIKEQTALAKAAGKSKVKHLSLKDLDAKAWKLASTYIRIRDKRANNGWCMFCKERPIEDAAHIIGRKVLSVKFNLNNLFGFCKFCNWSDRFIPGYHDRIVSWYIERYGVQTYHELVRQSQMKVDDKRSLRENAIAEYKNKLEGE